MNRFTGLGAFLLVLKKIGVVRGTELHSPLCSSRIPGNCIFKAVTRGRCIRFGSLTERVANEECQDRLSGLHCEPLHSSAVRADPRELLGIPEGRYRVGVEEQVID